MRLCIIIIIIIIVIIALSTSPFNSLAHTALNQHEEARQCYLKASQLDPENTSYQENLRMAEGSLRTTQVCVEVCWNVFECFGGCVCVAAYICTAPIHATADSRLSAWYGRLRPRQPLLHAQQPCPRQHGLVAVVSHVVDVVAVEHVVAVVVALHMFLLLLLL